MENEKKENDNLDEKMEIRKRIKDKFKTIAAETKAIKEEVMYLLFYCVLLFQRVYVVVLWSFYFQFSLWRFFFQKSSHFSFVAHEITKIFWKNSHIENMPAGFFLRCQNLLRYFITEMMHLQALKYDFNVIQLRFRHSKHLKMTVWISVLWKVSM